MLLRCHSYLRNGTSTVGRMQGLRHYIMHNVTCYNTGNICGVGDIDTGNICGVGNSGFHQVKLAKCEELEEER